MNKPGFIVVGAAKSGTTSLFEYLRRHPDIFLPPGKEIGYFADDLADTKGIKSFSDYLNYFSSATERQICGDVTTAYLYSSTAALNIYNQLGKDVKIIMILRNPVDMIYSLWKQNVRDGGELLSLQEAIEKAPERAGSSEFLNSVQGSIVNYDYVNRARYYKQVKRYIDIFGNEKVKIFIFENFFNNINSSLKELYGFIGVDPDFLLESYNIYNPAGTVHSKILHNLYTRKSLLSRTARLFLHPKIRSSIRMWLYKLNTKPVSYPDLDNDLYERLKTELADDVRNLEKLINGVLKDVWF